MVLLIDEIDRVDFEFEALLLEVLSDFQVTIPELGTVVARTHPHVILTSNATRDLSEALRRRCLYLHLDYPDSAREREIILARAPEVPEQLAEQVARAVAAVRRLELAKPPEHRRDARLGADPGGDGRRDPGRGGHPALALAAGEDPGRPRQGRARPEALRRELGGSRKQDDHEACLPRPRVQGTDPRSRCHHRPEASADARWTASNPLSA